MARIELSNMRGVFTEVDDELVYKTEIWKLYWDRKGVYVGNRSSKVPLTHHLFGVPPKGKAWDHIDRRPLNNKRENVRLADIQQNNWNRGKMRSGQTSNYIGVSWSKTKQKWQASVMHDRISYHLGYFTSETDAAHAYNKFIKEKRGKFAVLNFTM